MLTMNTLNKAQKQAVEYNSGPLLIVAGAGTGKTTVITQKIAYLIENKLATPEQILALTFTDKAAFEMVERVDELVNVGYADMQISTFHSFAERLLREYGLEIGLPTKFKILNTTDAWLLMRKNFHKFNLDYYKPLGNPARHIHELITHFSKCKEELITTDEYLDYAQNLQLDKDISLSEEKTRLMELANAYHTYNQLLLDNNALDLSDLIFYTLKLFQTRPTILNNLKKRFKYILIDEFQDVNWAQYQLIQKISENGSFLTVVGDDDQSIYAFRGANVQNILRFKKDYPKTQEIVLNENYRSGQEILDTAYKSIQNNNPHRLEAELKINKRLNAASNKKSEVIPAHFFTGEEELDFVVSEIKKIKSIDKEAVWDDFAILIRANSQATPVMNVLENAGIPYEFLAASGLYRQPIVLDAINFLKIINDHHESNAIYRLLRLPFFKFSENDLQCLAYNRQKRTLSYYTAIKQATQLKLSNEGQKICTKLLKLIHEGMRQTRELKITEILVNFFEESGYNDYLIREEEKGNGQIIRQIYQLRQFLEGIKKYEENNPGNTVADWLEHFAYVLESGEQGAMYQPSDTPDSVNIITVHKAKGLEYKYVFIINLTEEKFPSKRHGGGLEIPEGLIKENLVKEDIHFEEERRLFYVAVTRAKEKLYLTSADNYGGVRNKKSSRFLAELGFIFKADKNTNKSEASEKLITPKKTPAEKKKITYQIPKTFSYSQIKTYLQCPFSYKLQYVLDIPQKGKGVFSYGNTLHNTLYKFYQRIQELNSAKQESLFGTPVKIENNDGKIKTPSVEELLKLYEESWVDEWYESAEQKNGYFKKGQETLREFYKKHENSWTVPVALENGFRIKIGDYTLKGRIDRVDQLLDGKLEIIDYKTGKGKDKLTTDDKDQLLLYQIVALELPEYTNIGEVEKLTYYYLDADLSEMSFLGKEKEVEKFKEKIIKAIEDIKAGKFECSRNEFNCSFCPFKEICE